MDGLTILSILFGFATAIFWMVVGWRAMRAHERIADSSEKIAHASDSLSQQRSGNQID